MTVDVRTRVDGAITTTDPDAFLADELASALETSGPRLAPALAHLPLRPLTVEVDGAARWTLVPDGDRAVVTDAAAPSGAVHLRLSAEQLADLAVDQVTPMGWLASGTLDIEGGR